MVGWCIPDPDSGLRMSTARLESIGKVKPQPQRFVPPAVAGALRTWERSFVANSEPAPRISDLLRMPAGAVDLQAIDTRATPGFTGSGKADATTAICHLRPHLADMQEQLYAEGRTGGQRSLLLVLQGMDTAGKGSTVKHVLGPRRCSTLRTTWSAST